MSKNEITVTHTAGHDVRPVSFIPSDNHPEVEAAHMIASKLFGDLHSVALSDLGHDGNFRCWRVTASELVPMGMHIDFFMYVPLSASETDPESRTRAKRVDYIIHNIADHIQGLISEVKNLKDDDLGFIDYEHRHLAADVIRSYLVLVPHHRKDELNNLARFMDM